MEGYWLLLAGLCSVAGLIAGIIIDKAGTGENNK
jgi:hypothetical protein